MTKKDVLELKRRLKKNECTFTKLCGCYVNGEKEIVLNLEETFLNLKDEEFYKYLEIAKKTLSGAIGNNLLELDFPLEEEKAGGKQQFLLGLKESKLKNSGLLESFYQLIIDHYDYAGNYLILVFHDAYDVMTKTSDNSKLDESEEVYEYLLCAICPVTLTKAALGYLEDDNRIGPRLRDWVVNAPDTGFLFPAFTERSTDIHSVLYYTKEPKEPHKEFMESVLGCPPKQTATEQKNTFQKIINNAIQNEDKSNKIFLEIQESLNQLIDEHATYKDSDEEPLILTSDSILEILESCDLPEEITKKIEDSYTEQFSDTPPVVDHLIDSKVLAANAVRKREKELVEKVQLLQVKLEEVTSTQNNSYSSDRNVSNTTDPWSNEATDGALSDVLINDESIGEDSHQLLDSYNSDSSADLAINNTNFDNNPELTASNDSINSIGSIETDSAYKDSSDLDSDSDNNELINDEANSRSKSNFDVVLRVKPQKIHQITSQIIDGKKCLVIPLDENEQADVNELSE